jgi:hypothetical protein
VKPAQVPAELQRLIRQTVSDPGSVLPREEAESVPQWTMRAVLAAVLPAHEALVLAKADLCGVSMVGGFRNTTIGPCVLRVHHGDVHQASDGGRWFHHPADPDAQVETLRAEIARLRAESPGSPTASSLIALSEQRAADWQRHAEQLKATIERVRAHLDFLGGQITALEIIRPVVGATFRRTLDRLRTALDQPEPGGA